MKVEFTAVFQQVPEGFIGFVEELPGANTQGATLEEARENLREAVALVLEANRELSAPRDIRGPRAAPALRRTDGATTQSGLASLVAKPGNGPEATRLRLDSGHRLEAGADSSGYDQEPLTDGGL